MKNNPSPHLFIRYSPILFFSRYADICYLMRFSSQSNRGESFKLWAYFPRLHGSDEFINIPNENKYDQDFSPFLFVALIRWMYQIDRSVLRAFREVGTIFHRRRRQSAEERKESSWGELHMCLISYEIDGRQVFRNEFTFIQSSYTNLMRNDPSEYLRMK